MHPCPSRSQVFERSHQKGLGRQGPFKRSSDTYPKKSLIDFQREWSVVFSRLPSETPAQRLSNIPSQNYLISYSTDSHTRLSKSPLLLIGVERLFLDVLSEDNVLTSARSSSLRQNKIGSNKSLFSLGDLWAFVLMKDHY